MNESEKAQDDVKELSTIQDVDNDNETQKHKDAVRSNFPGSCGVQWYLDGERGSKPTGCTSESGFSENGEVIYFHTTVPENVYSYSVDFEGTVPSGVGGLYCEAECPMAGEEGDEHGGSCIQVVHVTRKDFTITASKNEGGKVYINNVEDGNTVKYGSSLDYKVVPDDGYGIYKITYGFGGGDSTEVTRKLGTWTKSGYCGNSKLPTFFDIGFITVEFKKLEEYPEFECTYDLNWNSGHEVVENYGSKSMGTLVIKLKPEILTAFTDAYPINFTATCSGHDVWGENNWEETYEFAPNSVSVHQDDTEYPIKFGITTAELPRTDCTAIKFNITVDYEKRDCELLKTPSGITAEHAMIFCIRAGNSSNWREAYYVKIDGVETQIVDEKQFVYVGFRLKDDGIREGKSGLNRLYGSIYGDWNVSGAYEKCIAEWVSGLLMYDETSGKLLYKAAE